jgi:2-phosphosulfolactate phosphatase
MKVDVVFLPALLKPEHLRDRAVVVFDVLRATTTAIAALTAGVSEIRIFEDAESAMRAACSFNGPRILCGERDCLPPPGFDLGNSPASFDAKLHKDKTVFMATTNGTRAIVAAQEAKELLTGALVNASAVARHLLPRKVDGITLLCAGTAGEIATEDVIGAGAVLNSLLHQQPRPDLELTDSARIALSLFRLSETNLPRALRDTRGGRNVIAARLDSDIDDAAALDTSRIVPRVRDRIIRISQLD